MITATNEDNMQMMKRYEDNFFDLAIVDPPYGIGIAKGGVLHNNSKYSKGFVKNKKYKPTEWDGAIPNKEYFTELQRVSKNQIIWGGNYFLDYLGRTKSFVIWYKKGFDKNPNFSLMVFAWSSFENLPKYYDIPWLGFGYINSGETKIHPTQKPVKLYESVLMDYAKEGFKILDTHRGSASLDIACDKLGFDLWTCELDADYFNDGNKRLKEHQSQIRMF